jgi:hypothetical protein
MTIWQDVYAGFLSEVWKRTNRPTLTRLGLHTEAFRAINDLYRSALTRRVSRFRRRDPISIGQRANVTGGLHHQEYRMQHTNMTRVAQFNVLMNPKLLGGDSANSDIFHPQIYVGFSNVMHKEPMAPLCRLGEKDAQRYQTPESYLVLQVGHGSFKLVTASYKLDGDDHRTPWKEVADALEVSEKEHYALELVDQRHYADHAEYQKLMRELAQTQRMIRETQRKAPSSETALQALTDAERSIQEKIDAFKREDPSGVDQEQLAQARQKRQALHEKVSNVTAAYLRSRGLYGASRYTDVIDRIVDDRLYVLELENYPLTNHEGAPQARLGEKTYPCDEQLIIPEGFMVEALFNKEPGRVHFSENRKYFLSWEKADAETTKRNGYELDSLIVGEWDLEAGLEDRRRRGARAVILNGSDWHLYADTRDHLVSKAGFAELITTLWPHRERKSRRRT